MNDEEEDHIHRKVQRKRHTFTVSFADGLLFDPKTSFPGFCRGVVLDSFSSSFPFSSCFVSSSSVGFVCGLPSKRFPDPVNGVNLGTLFASSSSSFSSSTARKIIFLVDLIPRTKTI